MSYYYSTTKKFKLNNSTAAAAMTAADLIAASSGTVNNNADNENNILLGNSEDDDASISGMSNKLTETILGFLGYKDIMKARICCRKFREAARNTIVPWVDYGYAGRNSYTHSQCMETQVCTNSLKRYKAMVAMSTALPNLQQLSVCTIWRAGRGDEDKYCDGEDPDEERTLKTADWNTHDIQMISKFRRLRDLRISSNYLNGRYPVFFNYPRLEKLSIDYCTHLKWDLKLLVGLPSLRELYVSSGGKMTGNIKNLSALKNTLESVRLSSCSKIEGDFMSLADFPLLKVLKLSACPLVTGDVRDIGENDFPMLTELTIGSGIIGSGSHQFQRIADAPSVMQAIHRLKQRNPPLLSECSRWTTWSLSRDSPEWYDSNGERGHPSPPLTIAFVQVGSRVGWRWKSESTRNSCEINWIDPEPDQDSSNYDDYLRELQSIQEEIFCFEGYHQPPSHDDYKRLCEEFYGI